MPEPELKIGGNAVSPEESIERRFRQTQYRIYLRTDRMFACLLAVEWLASIVAALIISPRTWSGAYSQVHVHVWSALIFGLVAASLPIFLAIKNPGETFTRHVIATGQIAMAGLLIHVSGGRIETHFLVFGTLAFLAFYRDWPVLITASVVTALDHVIRGLYWPATVYGVSVVEPWRWLEHAGWVAFTDVFLISSCIQSVKEMRAIAAREVVLENSNVDLEAARSTAEKSDQAKSAFLANMSHEFRTPLSSVIGFAEVLRDQALGPLNENQQNCVGSVLSSGTHLLRIINDVLDLSQLEAGYSTLHLEEFEPGAAVQAVVDSLTAAAAKKNIKLEANIAPGLPAIEADQQKFHQILRNLADNAIKFTPEGGIITISAEGEDNLQIAIADTGIGIKPEDQERIFKQFEQIDTSYSRPEEGTGLGLTLTKKLVEAHGGMLSVSSTGIAGEGSVFTVFLPYKSSGSNENQRLRAA